MARAFPDEVELVMAGLGPAIHVVTRGQTWMRGSSPRMTATPIQPRRKNAPDSQAEDPITPARSSMRNPDPGPPDDPVVARRLGADAFYECCVMHVGRVEARIDHAFADSLVLERFRRFLIQPRDDGVRCSGRSEQSHPEHGIDVESVLDQRWP